MGRKKKAKNGLDNKKLTFAYVQGNSLFHKLNPLSKLIFIMCLTIITLISSSILFLAIIFMLIFILALLTGISLKNLTHKLRYIIMLLIFGVTLNIFFNAIPSEQEVILFYLFGIEWLPIRKLAVYFALRAFFIVLILYTSTIIYSYTTSMRDFVYSLMRLGIPYKYCFAFMVGIRYMPLIEQEAKTISLAQRARGFGQDRVNSIKKAYNLIFERLSATLISILRKSNVTSISMENRCFNLYKDRTNLIKIKFKKKDLLFIAFCLLFFIGILLYLLKLLSLPQFPSLYGLFNSML